MADTQPVTELDARYSSEDATPMKWADAVKLLETSELFWLSTVRPDGRPHVTPLIAVWLDGALHFCTGPDERKAMNLASNPHCVVTTGCNSLNAGVDLVIEGDALRESDDDTLQRLADLYVEKYGEEWRFTVSDGVFRHEAGEALVFSVHPVTGFGFGKGPSSEQTRWRF